MTLQRYDSLYDMLNRILSSGLPNSSYYSYPVHDVYVDPDKTLVFEFAVSGFSKDEVSVELANNILTVSGKKITEKPDDLVWLHRKIATRDFEIKYTVPSSYTGDNASAKYRDGILRVEIPISESVKPKLLSID